MEIHSFSLKSWTGTELDCEETGVDWTGAGLGPGRTDRALRLGLDWDCTGTGLDWHWDWTGLDWDRTGMGLEQTGTAQDWDWIGLK